MGYTLTKFKTGKSKGELPPIEDKTTRVANKKMEDATGAPEAIKKSPFAHIAGKGKTAKKEETAEEEESKIKTVYKTAKDVLERLEVAIKKTNDSFGNYKWAGLASAITCVTVAVASAVASESGALPPAAGITAELLGLGLEVVGMSGLLCISGNNSSADEIEKRLAYRALENVRLGEEKSKWKTVEGVLESVSDAAKKTYRSGRNYLVGGVVAAGLGIDGLARGASGAIASLATSAGVALPPYTAESILFIAILAGYISASYGLGKLLGARSIRRELEKGNPE